MPGKGGKPGSLLEDLPQLSAVDPPPGRARRTLNGVPSGESLG